MKYTNLFFFITVLFFQACSSHAVRQDQFRSGAAPFVFTDNPDYHAYAKKRMQEAGISPEFIEQINSSYVAHFEKHKETAQKIITLNLFGFLYHGDYSAHNSAFAQKKVKQYLRKHHNTFKATEKKLGVPSSVIASLLWVETKLGKRQGTYPLPLVYYSLLLSGDPKACEQFENEIPRLLERTDPELKTYSEVRTKLATRCESKSQWALEELKAIDALFIAKKMRPFKKTGSFAGAFGLPQFIPSSFIKFAQSQYRKTPDLTKDSDAILSVAYFLKKFGWKNNSIEAKKEALFNYNRSRDYGEVILQIAQAIKPFPDRNKSLTPKQKDCGPVPPGASFDKDCKIVPVKPPTAQQTENSRNQS